MDDGVEDEYDFNLWKCQFTLYVYILPKYKLCLVWDQMAMYKLSQDIIIYSNNIKRKDLNVSIYVCNELAQKLLDGFG